MRMVFDTTFCGDYAGGSFASACPNTGQSSCDAYVRTQPDAFKSAFWSVTRLDVYQRSGSEKPIDNPELGAGISANHPQSSSSGTNWIWPLFFILCLSSAGYFLFKRFGNRIHAVADCNEKLADACNDGKPKAARSREVTMTASPTASARKLREEQPRQSGEAAAPSPERPAGAAALWQQFTGAVSSVSATPTAGWTAVPPNSPPRQHAQVRQASTFVTTPTITPVPSGNTQRQQPSMPNPSFMMSQQQSFFMAPNLPGNSFAPIRNAPTFTGGHDGSGSAMGSRDLVLPPTLPYNQSRR